jgi:hypothetical protein
MGEPREYKFFRSFSAKVETGWPLRKAEQFWRRLRERKIAGTNLSFGYKKSSYRPPHSRKQADVLIIKK